MLHGVPRAAAGPAKVRHQQAAILPSFLLITKSKRVQSGVHLFALS